MRQVIVVFAVLAVVAIGIIAFVGDHESRPRTAAIMGVVHGSRGLIYQVKDSEHCLAVSLPVGWTEQSNSNLNYGGRNGYYQASAAFCKPNGAFLAMVQRDSSNPQIVTIQGVAYDLEQGSVFRIRAPKAPAKTDDESQPAESATAGTPPAAASPEVIQLPFTPLDITPNYVDQLDKYFTERGYD